MPALSSGLQHTQIPEKMKRTLLVWLAAVAVAAAALYALYGSRQEILRLRRNQAALAAEMTHYRTCAGSEAASAQALRLRCAEYEQLRAEDARRIRELGIRIRRLEAAATLVARQQAAFEAPLRETIVIRQHEMPQLDTLRTFRWEDAWTQVDGVVGPDSVQCRVVSIDTLRQIVHRVPRKFLFIRWGTKALRQEIVPANPHTRIVYAEYVQLAR